MSEPSPEAKQAAEAKGYRQDKGYEYGAFVDGYGTATAKAREVNQALIDNAKISARIHIEEKKALERDLKDADKVIAKAREELERYKAALERSHNRLNYVKVYGKGDFDDWEEILDQNLALLVPVKQLAHQQPSGDFSKSGMSAGGIQTWREASEVEQPSAPTADVEKIAREAASDFKATHSTGFTHEEFQKWFTKVAAQACAPLAAALEGLVEAVTAEVNEKGAGGYLLARLSDARAALPGTGENVSKQERNNETTNSNSIGGNPTA